MGTGINITGGLHIGGSGFKIGVLPVITANLVEYLDVVTYSGSGSTWTADTGSNATLFNTPTYTSSSPTYFSFSKNSFEYATAPNLGSKSSWTIEAWFRVTSSLTGQVTMVVGNQYNGSNLNFSMGTNNAPSSYNIVVGFANGTGWHNTSGFAPTLNTWYHVVGTYDGSTVKQYVNGSLDTQLSYTGTSQSGGEVRIARRWDDTATVAGNFFPGDIGVVRIYGAALSAADVAQNFNAEKTRFGL